MKAHYDKPKGSSLFDFAGTDNAQCPHCKRKSSCDRLRCNYIPKTPGNSKGKTKTKRGRGE